MAKTHMDTDHKISDVSEMGCETYRGFEAFLQHATDTRTILSDEQYDAFEKSLGQPMPDEMAKLLCKEC